MNMKQFTAFLLALSVTAGSTAAMAAETISLDDTEVSAHSEQMFVDTAEDAAQAETPAVHNDAVLNDEFVGSTFYSGDTDSSLKLTISHPKGAPEGRAIVSIIDQWCYGDFDYSYPADTDWESIDLEKEHADVWYYHTYEITKSTKTTSTVSFPLDIKNSYCGPRWVVVRTQRNVDGQWVTDTQHAYKIHVAPRLTISNSPVGIVLNKHTLYFEEFTTSPIQGEFSLYRKEGSSENWERVENKGCPFYHPEQGGYLGYEETDTDPDMGLWGGPYVDINVKNGTLYSYYAEGYFHDSEIKPSKVVSYYYLDAPEVSVSNSSTGKTMYLSWDRNTEADGYEIRYKDTSVKTIDYPYYPHEYEWEEEPIVRKASGSKTTTLKLKNRTPGRQYWIQARSYKTINDTKYYSGWSDPTLRYPEGMSAPSTPTFTIKNSSTGKTMYVSRKADPKVSGFVVQYATKLNSNGNLVNFRTVDVPAKDGYTLTLKKRTPGKQYWVRVRSYCYCSEEKLYSDWTELKLRYPKK